MFFVVFFSVGFFLVVVLLLLFCFVFLLIVLPVVAKQNERIQIFCLNLHFESTATPLTSLFPSTQLLVYLPRQGEIKVNTFGVFFTDLKIKNMRMCNCREYRDLVPFDNLSTEVIDKNETDQLLSFIPADVSKESFPSHEHLFPIALPHPVPNRASKLLMTIVTHDLI